MSEAIFPASEWQEPVETGWSEEHRAHLVRELSAGGSTALIVVEGGKPVFQWGDLALKSSVASVRKSLISILYGIYVAEGRIKLDETLQDLRIDDIGGLTDRERQATVEHLLQARSGVYHPSVYDTARGRPLREEYAPGSFWYYNNWDFNVLATIFERQTGETVFDALESRLAVPLLMQDYVREDGRYQHGPESEHPVYKLRFSARDLARVGLLYLRNGRWGANQVVPETWVRESVRAHSDLGGGRGYGYLWWTAEAHAPGDAISTHTPLFYASGLGGQYIVVITTLDLVVVHRAARVDHGITHDRMGKILRLAIAAMLERG
ncbi:serine hydrolase domain-containing protein [Mesorhizobium sp. AaZ16]|uniref:serine hydrolase domain-containing protein n=1 Tax=Mesorhizobium sp. AaZ16 TaxID=3402289 RepID=UPI00374F2512